MSISQRQSQSRAEIVVQKLSKVKQNLKKIIFLPVYFNTELLQLVMSCEQSTQKCLLVILKQYHKKQKYKLNVVQFNEKFLYSLHLINLHTLMSTILFQKIHTGSLNFLYLFCELNLLLELYPFYGLFSLILDNESVSHEDGRRIVDYETTIITYLL